MEPHASLRLPVPPLRPLSPPPIESDRVTVFDLSQSFFLVRSLPAFNLRHRPEDGDGPTVDFRVRNSLSSQSPFFL